MGSNIATLTIKPVRDCFISNKNRYQALRKSEEDTDEMRLVDWDRNEEFEVKTELAGTLCIWTDFIHGWHNQYMVLRGNKLSYYKSENKTGLGCRGVLNLSRGATVMVSLMEENNCKT